MAYTTNVPQPTFGPNGYVAPTEEDILVGEIADFQAAFNNQLNLDAGNSESLATPQGQLAQSLTALIGNVNNTFLQYTNLVDPAFSYGRMQDAIARIYFIERFPSKQTLVQCLCVGLAGVIIPVGATAIDQGGNIYSCTAQGVIPVGGSITLPFECVLPGPIVCPAGYLNAIYQSIPGWDTINNASAGEVGTFAESRSAFEQRRYASVAVNSTGWMDAVRGAVLSVENVIDCYVTENDQTTNQTIGGYVLLPNSMYVAVVGGLASDVAYAIWTRKPPGCAYNGNTTVTVYDTQVGYTPPFPSYAVTFETPANLPFVFAVQMADNGYVPSNALTLIQNAIVGAFSGLDGNQRVRIGQTVFAARFYSTLATLWTNAQVVSIYIGSTNGAAAVFVASISGTVMIVSSVSSGALASNQIVDDLAGVILPGTSIVGQVSGTTGGVGVYTITPTQTVVSETMYGIAPALSEVAVNISQYPAISAENISLSLV